MRVFLSTDSVKNPVKAQNSFVVVVDVVCLFIFAIKCSSPKLYIPHCLFIFKCAEGKEMVSLGPRLSEAVTGMQ